jgi:cell wall-associated NlpC family hydrolase
MASGASVRALRACVTASVAAALVAAAPADAKYAERTLKVGSKGGDVKRLQRLLSRAGFHATVDGWFGRGTRAAQRDFERSADRRVNGRASRQDQRVLRRVVRDARPDAPERTGKAVISADGRTAIAPESAPRKVKLAIAAANRITRKPYKYGGGHGRWEDSGYDCSGAVSYALRGGRLLGRPRASGGFMSWARAGRGEWITVYANSGHAYVVIAGLRFDTSSAGAGGGRGPRWRTTGRSSRGYVARHPAAY